MLSIAIFSECYHPMHNGVVVSVSSFARILTELGHQVTIFTARHPDQDPADDAIEGVYRFPSITLPTKARYPIAIPIATGKARALLSEQGFDLIHSNSPMLMGHVAIAYQRRLNIPLVFTYHTLLEEYTHYIPLPQTWMRTRAVRLSREYCNTADHIITPTEHVASRLRRYRVEKPITVIPTGIDIDLMDLVPSGTIRKQYHIPTAAPLLVYAGRLAKEKNIPRLLSAFCEIIRREPETHLLLVGGGPFEEDVRGLISAYNIGHRTRMTGYVDRTQVVQALNEADIFIFASKTETQGLVLGEAMACHIPVVAVDADAPRELIEHGKDGLLVPDADGPFAEAVVSLLRDAPRRHAMGTFARQRAESVSASRCTERLLNVYTQVIHDQRSHRLGLV